MSAEHCCSYRSLRCMQTAGRETVPVLSMPEHRTLRAQVRQLFARQETAMA